MQPGKKYWLLYPLSLLYGAVVAIRNFLYDKEFLVSTEHNVPIICVGNLSVGGTGKTPHSEMLIRMLSPHFRVALLSRGYKRKSRGFRIVTPEMQPWETGDESLQIARKFPGITVAVDRKRNNGVKEILRQRPETEVIILDDGFQHRSLKPGKAIILTDYSNPWYNDQLLPCGTLREQKHNMCRADIILVSKSPEEISPMQMRIMSKQFNKYPYQNIYFTTISYGNPVPLDLESAVAVPDAEEFSAGTLLLLTGIANAAPLKEHLQQKGASVIEKSFADHHNFTDSELEQLTEEIEKRGEKIIAVFTTEKDAVRLTANNLPRLMRERGFYIPVEVRILNNDEKEFENNIINYVRSNKRDSKIPEIKGI